MTKKWIAINLMLLIAAGLLGWQLYVSSVRFGAENDPAKIQAVKKKSGPEGGLPLLQALPKFSAADFAAIPAQNLFAEARKPDAQVQTPALPEPDLPIKPIVTAVVISGSQRVATVIDPSAASPTGIRKAQVMRLGDTFKGYVVTDITEDSIVLELGTRREIIPIHDVSKRPAATGKTPILATRVVGFSPTQSGGGAATAIAAGGTPRTVPARPTQVVNPVQQPGGRAAGQRGQPVQTAPTQFPGAQTAAPIQLLPNQSIDSQGRLVTITPFGNMVGNVVQPVQQPVKK